VRADCLNALVGQLGRRKAAAMLLETAEFFVFVWRDEIARDRSVARYRYGLSLGEHSVAVKVPGELRSRDGVSGTDVFSL
jgi:hypothetical protein